MGRDAATGRDIGDTPARTYGQFCPVAAGLDVVGDRWVLLICRELSLGDQRFTDLRRRLPGIAPNLLSARLRHLEAAGLVTTAELPPPAARTVYRLTEEGQRIRPVLRALARFGAHHLVGAPAPEFGAERAALTLLLPWAGRDDGFRLRLQVPAGDHADVIVDPSGARVEVAGDVAPDAVLRCDVVALADARRDDTAVDGALTGAGADRARRLFGLRVTGDDPAPGTLGG